MHGRCRECLLLLFAGKCHDPPEVSHATHNGPKGQKTFPLGTQLTYSCGAGYNIDGFFRAMCVGEGRWVGPRMICSPRRCGHPGDIAHGHREGVAFVYPNRVTYVCSEGYELVGRPFRTCLANGRWSGTVPICRAVTCPRVGVPANGRMTGVDFTYGAVVSFNCLRGFKLLGPETKRCQQDGTWSGPPTTCAMVDCGLPGPFYNGYLDGQQTTFGSVVVFRCYGKTTFEGNSSSTTCQENGEWANSVPKCWRKCEVPRLANGTVQDHLAGLYVKHKEKLSFSCDPGHELSDETSSECFNGTWSHLPTCLPAPCKSRPPSTRHGLVRFYTMKHGDKAKYTCSTGYELDGDVYAVCLYGKWTGTTPTCNPVYCNYPGTVEHGQVLLVGIIGKYEYRPYVRRIGQNEKIEFNCEKGYTHVGPRAATCIGGKWSPIEMPVCVPGRHPSLHIFRGRYGLR
ncbi:hypothetical protein NP493_268g03054 [Ridgeia piscesae]|uniref:Sushi domain-containing protein n=1 Tax=Ridgeia piscesae TaxID=27915 RepID=A0AAD9NXR4_RIDPI|nr:hypothetical protein NP493_268g03054 [Ridgeia piscesae]